LRGHGTKNKSQQGIVITLVAVFVLFVLGAMAALSIDVVTFYTARSEAQLAADGAALAGARVLVNSGATSDTTGVLMPSAQSNATAVATQVALQNSVGGGSLTNVNVTYGGTDTNPTVTVSVQKTNLPTFFARIWGKTQATVGASATAEAYNPSGGSTQNQVPVAPLCVKPWLLPNMDPTNGGRPIFVVSTGTPNPGSNLLGWTYNTQGTGTEMLPACPGGNCPAPPLPTPQAWNYYPGNDDPTSFPHPTNSLATCPQIPTPTNYQESIMGCVQTPMSCNQQTVNIDTTGNSSNADTAEAVNCLTHARNNGGDTITTTPAPPTAPPLSQPLYFVAGADNPIPGLDGNEVMVSDSIVTVPVFNVTGAPPTNPVTIVGFVQLFLNPNGDRMFNNGRIKATVINLAGCGNSWTAQPIVGNGASPVTVRLISQ
jgi:Flp pilus assembly protein TadG